ncbi:Mad3/BUB1 homology region 1, partial [Athelia psychrophila]
YKSDLRYLKLWCQYARMVDPLAVFHDLMQNDIGERFALLYEDYAKALDAAGRQQDADRIYRRGIKRNARPVERLKK